MPCVVTFGKTQYILLSSIFVLNSYKIRTKANVISDKTLHTLVYHT